MAALAYLSLPYDKIVVFFEHEIAESVWDQTLQEVSKGEAEGPFSLSDIDADIPLSRRFGVRQGEKIRCVDDFSWSGINAAAQPTESPRPQTLDMVAAMIGTVIWISAVAVTMWAGWPEASTSRTLTRNVPSIPAPSDFRALWWAIHTPRR